MPRTVLSLPHKKQLLLRGRLSHVNCQRLHCESCKLRRVAILLPLGIAEKRRAQEQQRTQGGPGLAPSTVAGGGGADVVAAMAAFPGAAMTTPVVTTMAAPGGAATAVAMVPPPVAQFGIPLPPGKASSSCQGHAAVIIPPFILSFHVFLYFALVCILGCQLAWVFQKPGACDMCLR